MRNFFVDNNATFDALVLNVLLLDALVLDALVAEALVVVFFLSAIISTPPIIVLLQPTKQSLFQDIFFRS